MTAKAKPHEYPSAGRRIKAAVVDGALVFGVALLVLLITRGLTSQPVAVRIAVFVGIPVLYEPLLVAIRGQTLGHARFNLQVVTVGTAGRVGLFRSFARWLTKLVAGWWSMLLMLTTTRRQAVHDAVSLTVVVDDYLPPRQMVELAAGRSLLAEERSEPLPAAL